MPIIDIKGKKFNKWTVISRAENNSRGDAMWLCECECGTQRIVKGASLRSGNSKSCGCVRNQKLIENNHKKQIDLTDKKFGMLVVVEKNGTNNNGNIVWKCICECGNVTNVSSHDLLTGNTKSCGCQRKSSFGEQKIAELLEQNNIQFEREYTSTCILPSGFKARFDFYLPQLNTIIEYDGRQHFIQGNGVFDNAEKFSRTQEYDLIKNNWCKDNNIKLIRIPYTHYNNICIKDLLPETSEFQIDFPHFF